MHWRVMRRSGGCSSLRLFVGGVTTACGWLIILQATRVDGIILQAGRQQECPIKGSHSPPPPLSNWVGGVILINVINGSRQETRIGQDGTGEVRLGDPEVAVSVVGEWPFQVDWIRGVGGGSGDHNRQQIRDNHF